MPKVDAPLRAAPSLAPPASGAAALASTLLGSSVDAVLVRDASGIVLGASPGVEAVYGVAPEALLGRRAEAALPLDAETFRRVDAQVTREGSWRGTLVLDGVREGIVVDAAWSVVESDGGRRVLQVDRDVTALKLAERHALHAQRLGDIGTFAAGIAHDLNNVFAPILMSVEVMRFGTRDPSVVQMLDTIDESARRGAGMVHHILSFWSGYDPTRSFLNLARLVVEADVLVRRALDGDARTRVAAHHLGLVHGDHARLLRAVVDLALRARRRLGEGGEIVLSLREERVDAARAAARLLPSPGEYVVLRVEPTPARRVPRDVAEDRALAEVAEVARVHGGTLRSEDGVSPEDAPGDELWLPALGGSTSPTGTLRRGRGETVLVVDDEASFRGIVHATLESLGYRVLAAHDGAEAVRLFADHADAVDVAVVDMLMPVMNGAETVRALRARRPDLPVVAVTGLATDGLSDEAEAVGAGHFLRKPFTIASLLDAIGLAVDGARGPG